MPCTAHAERTPPTPTPLALPTPLRPSNGSKQVCVRRAPPLRAALDLDALDMPDIDGDIKSVQRELGAIFDVRCSCLLGRIT